MKKKIIFKGTVGELRRICKDQGLFDDYIPKDVLREKFIKKLKKALSNRDDDAFKEINILIVDKLAEEFLSEEEKA